MIKLYKKSFIIAIVLFLLLIQSIIEDKISILGYYDELIAIICLFYILLKTRLSFKSDIGFPLIIMCILVIIGLSGNIFSGVQSDPKAIFMDIGNMFKGFISFLAGYLYFESGDTEPMSYYTIKYLNILSKILVLPGFILAIVNLFYDIGMYTEYSYGIRAFNYIFPRVGNLNSVCVAILIVMTLYLGGLSGKEKVIQLLFIGMTLLLMISTLRSRAFICFIIYIAGYWYFIKKKRIKIKWIYFIPVALISLWVALPKIQFYFLESTTTARAVLLRYGIQTAITYFPLGAGFGSYGTYAAKLYYSSLYSLYGFSGYYGLDADEGAFLTDNYWPAIMGVFGFIGALCMLLLIVMIGRIIFEKTVGNEFSRLAALFGFARMCIVSLVSSSFFHTTSVIFMLLIALAIKRKKVNKIT